MGIDNNSTVAISIVVKDDGSIALLDAAEGKLVKLQNVSVGAGSAVGKMASGFGLAGANLGTFGTSLSTTTQQMTGFGTAAMTSAAAAESAGARTADSFRNAGGAVQGVRLAVQELGLRVPRAMESIIAHNATLAAGLQLTMGLFVGIGAVEIGAQMVSGLVELYDKWFDVTKAVEDYQQKAGEAAQQKMFDTGSLETEISLLRQAQAEVDRLNAKKQEAGAEGTGGGFLQYLRGAQSQKNLFGGEAIEGYGAAQGVGTTHPEPYTSGNDEQAAQAQKNLAIAQQRTAELQHQYAEGRQKAEEAYTSSALTGQARIAQGERDAIANAQLELAYTKEREQALQKINEATVALEKAQHVPEDRQTKAYHADPNAGNSAYDLAVRQAQQRTAGEHVAASRQENEQIIQMQNAAIDAGVRGEALYDEQRQQAIDAVARKFEQGEISKRAEMAETQAIDMKFHNEKMQRLQDEQYQTLKIQQDAQQSGLTGVPRIQAETQSRIADLTQNPANAGLSQDEVQKRRQAYEQQGDQDILAARREFTQKIQELEQRSSDQMLSGYARIAAQEKQSLDEVARAYQEFYGSDQGKWQGYQDAKTAIEQNAERERQQHAQQVNEQITQTEAQAARLVLPPWQAAQQQIVDEYAQRLAKIRAEVQQNVITEQQGAQEVNAAWQLANAQMQREAQQSRDQIAGQLEQLFSDPGKYMQNRAKQMMMDIIANWVQQLEQSSPKMQGILGGLLGQNKMGVGSPRQGIMDVFGSHRAEPMSESLGMPNGQLGTAGSTLTSAGMTLSSSGTMLMDAASAIQTAASQLGTSNPVASGGFGGLGSSSGSGFTGFGASPSAAGMPSFFGGGSTSTPGIAGAGGGLNGAFSVGNTATGGAGVSPSPMAPLPSGNNVPGQIMGAGGIALQGLQLATTLKNAAQSNNYGSSAGMQPTDEPPTSSSGVPGTVPDDATGTGGTDDSGGSSGPGPLGMATGLISGGMGLFGAFESGYNSKTFAGGLTSMIGGAMSGAAIGTMFMPGMGTIIGAAAGAAIGLLGDIFGDHGRSKAEQYNVDTVIPGLQKAMDGFSFGGGSYDSTSVGITNLQMQAQQQTRSWGSGAVSYYNSTIVPEITTAQQQVDREGAGGRSNVTMSAAQFDSGGVITSFGDMSTGPFSGFVHARLGERVMNPMASMMHASTLDAMNAGASALLTRGRTAPLGGGGGGGGGVIVQLALHAWDSRDVDRWLRSGGITQIQGHLNQNAGRYAGRGLNAT